jgi:xanthine/uracil permease
MLKTSIGLFVGSAVILFVSTPAHGTLATCSVVIALLMGSVSGFLMGIYLERPSKRTPLGMQIAYGSSDLHKAHSGERSK